MEVSERKVDPELTDGSAELTPLCEPCRADGKELEAHGFCNNCNEYMCPSCIKVHGKLTATKHHNVLGKQKMPTYYTARKKAPDVSCLELCKDHPPEAIKFFCPTHAQLCCGDCIVLDHRACKIDYIPRVAPSFTASNEFKAIVEKVETLEVACTNSERNLEAHEQSVLKLNMIEIKKIQAFRVEINEYLDKQEKALIKFMDDAKNKDTDCIRGWREDINAAKLTLAETKSRLKDQNNTASNIYIAAKHADNLLNDIQTMIMKAKTENLLTGYKFCRDKKTEELLSWNDALGRVDESKVRYLSKYDSSVFKKPQRLIITKEYNILEVCHDVLDEISRIDEPCVIVAIAGLFRTGKSYLMNLLADSQTGFAIGNSIGSTTKGIWVWCKDHPTQKDTVLMLLDTEGSGDFEQDPNHDNRIFTLATLLCSTLVYNMKGVFDQDGVNKLKYVSEISKNIKYGGICDEGNSLLQCVFPGFVIALRDLSLKLTRHGRNITSDEYLENCLESKTEKGVSFNKPRECIRKLFPQDKRRCFLFPVPGDGDVLKNMGSLRLQDLSTRFQTVAATFVSYIYSQGPKQLQANKPVNGSMFASLTRSYVEDLAKGAVVDVDSAFKRLK